MLGTVIKYESCFGCQMKYSENMADLTMTVFVPK